MNITRHTADSTAASPPSQLLPPDLRDALMATKRWPRESRCARIDQLTDEAVRRGFARPRHEVRLPMPGAGAAADNTTQGQA